MKNTVDVIIDGKIYKLKGEDTEDNMQLIGEKLNRKIREIEENLEDTYYNRSKIPVLVALNLMKENITLDKEIKEKKKKLQDTTILFNEIKTEYDIIKKENEEFKNELEQFKKLFRRK